MSNTIQSRIDETRSAAAEIGAPMLVILSKDGSHYSTFADEVDNFWQVGDEVVLLASAPGDAAVELQRCDPLNRVLESRCEVVPAGKSAEIFAKQFIAAGYQTRILPANQVREIAR